MPRKAKKPCTYGRCPELVEAGERYCEAHRKQGRKLDDNRPSFRQRGYDSRWDKVRALYLRRNPLCEKCGGIAELVHHIKPIDQGGELLNFDNLMSLCRLCHAREHAKV